jgi:hypothetical protein
MRGGRCEPATPAYGPVRSAALRCSLLAVPHSDLHQGCGLRLAAEFKPKCRHARLTLSLIAGYAFADVTSAA